jgi:homoserine dehydrogenase
MSITKLGIGLLGHGTVGRAVRQLLEKSGEIKSKHGVQFDIKKILVRRPNSERPNPIPEDLLALSFDEIIENREIDVIVEVMGGIIPAKEYILDALKAGKHVITANKALMGEAGETLVERARQHSRFFGYAASVTGFHDLCPSIGRSVLVKSLAGIFNGTSNFILTQIEEKKTYKEALEEAQKAGYAEANVSEDVDGYDTRNKLIIVSRLAYGVFLSKDEIPVSGIRKLALADMEFANELGYTVKLLGVSTIIDDDKISAFVGPCLVPLSHRLALVKGVNNGIEVFNEFGGEYGMIAAGAGGNRTATAILTDLLALAEGESILWPASAHFGVQLKISRAQVPMNYYVRMEVPNHPGVLGDVTKTFGKNEINIIRILQKDGHTDVVPLVLICGPIKERALRKVLDELEERKRVMSTPVFLPVHEPWTGAFANSTKRFGSTKESSRTSATTSKEERQEFVNTKT